jgi:predicted nuclease of predicted toxin-antitoxin system
MKLLLDENLSRRVVPFIQTGYPNSTQVTLVGLEQVDDRIIRQYAIDNDYVIVTKDADFYEMSLVHGQPPKIIWLKRGNSSKIATIKALLDNQDLIEGALVIENKACIKIM